MATRINGRRQHALVSNIDAFKEGEYYYRYGEVFDHEINWSPIKSANFVTYYDHWVRAKVINLIYKGRPCGHGFGGLNDKLRLYNRYPEDANGLGEHVIQLFEKKDNVSLWKKIKDYFAKK